MARPKKKALDYFSFDVDFFGDDKILPIAREFGIKGELTAVKLLCAIYRNGYFAEWSDRTRNKLLGELPTVSEKLLDEIVSRLVKWGFFDKALFDSAHVLTSHGIQKRYFEAVRRCKRQVEMDGLPHLLIGDEKRVSTGGNPVSTGGNPVSAGGNPTKEKETKVSLIKETKVSLNSTTTTTSRVYASVREEVEALKKEQSWVEQECMMYHLAPADIMERLDAFVLWCECSGKTPDPNDPNDTKRHFTSWLGSHIQNEAKRRRNGMGKADSSGDKRGHAVHRWQGLNDWHPGRLDEQRRKERRWQS